MDSILQDLRFGLRSLLKAPAFTATAALTLALGIGCSIVMFGLIEGVVLDRPAVREVERIVAIWGVDRQTGADRLPVSIPNFLEWRRRTAAFEELGAFESAERRFASGGEPRRVATEMVSANFFHLLGAAPRLGRGFGTEEESPGAPRVALISEGMWRSYFGGEARALGQIVHLDGLPYTVIGVMPADFWYPSRGIDVWTPLTLDPGADRGSGCLMVVGRMRSNTGVSQAQAELDAVTHSLEQEFPSTNRGMSARLVSVENEQRKKLGLALAFGLGPAVLVLIIGCSNVSHLLLARGFARRAEFATRAALGARRSRIVRQLLTENFMVALAGAALGALGAYLGLAALRNVLQSMNPDMSTRIQLHGGILAFGLAAALMVPLLSGLIPSLKLSRANVNEVLRPMGIPTGAQVSMRRLPPVVFQIALAMLLLVVTVLFGRSLINLERRVTPDIDVRNLITLTITPAAAAPDLSKLLMGLTSIPGVAAVGVTEHFPVVAGTRNLRALWLDHAGKSTEAFAMQLNADTGFIAALRLPRRRGDPGSGGTLKGAVVSESFARHYGGGMPGINIRKSDGSWIPVVQVVGDWLTDPGTGNPLPTVYFPIVKSDTPVQIVVRAIDGPAVIPGVRRAVRAWNQAVPIEDCSTVYQSLNSALAGSRFVIRAIGLFGFLALLLASVGVYGTMSYSITRRTREMGIRIALGATKGRIFALVLGQAALLIAVGLVVGWLAGVGAASLISHELVGIAPLDPATAGICSLVILTVGLLATYFPARRAASVEPTAAIRFE